MASFFLAGSADNGDGRLLWITIHYGKRMRAWIDVGFSIEPEE